MVVLTATVVLFAAIGVTACAAAPSAEVLGVTGTKSDDDDDDDDEVDTGMAQLFLGDGGTVIGQSVDRDDDDNDKDNDNDNDNNNYDDGNTVLYHSWGDKLTCS